MKVIDIMEHMPQPDLPPQLYEIIDLAKIAFEKHKRPLMIITEDADGSLYPIYPHSQSQTYGMLAMLTKLLDIYDGDYYDE